MKSTSQDAENQSFISCQVVLSANWSHVRKVSTLGPQKSWMDALRVVTYVAKGDMIVPSLIARLDIYERSREDVSV